MNEQIEKTDKLIFSLFSTMLCLANHLITYNSLLFVIFLVKKDRKLKDWPKICEIDSTFGSGSFTALTYIIVG
ncbi:hypothetical protein DP116_06955 [Brasilonema bromeliae SPC951]|uniref:Uncharacterized protein n=1 Tax=Brasilonema bromeliae SPC951 TaxID=385972 RepID=A0ABX1P4A4_9CYAN|nr:hypothetical protein [Brasilonema bromeliae SPC951]